MESGIRSDVHILEVLKIPLIKLRIASAEYNQDLEGYLSCQEFYERIKAFNSISLKLSINRMIVQVPFIFIMATLILSVVAVKTLGPFNYQDRIILGIVLLIFLVLIMFMYFCIHQKLTHINSLSTLIQEFNKEDNKRNVNWKLYRVEESQSSRAYFKLRPNIKMYLIIEIGLPPAYQAENVHITIHDNESTALSIENSPPYEGSLESNDHNSCISLPPPVYSEY